MFGVVSAFLAANAVTIGAVIGTILATLGGVKYFAWKQAQPKTEEFVTRVLFKNLVPSSNGKYAQLLVATPDGVLRMPYTVESVDAFDKLRRDASIVVTVPRKVAKNVRTLKVIDVQSIGTF